MNYNYKKFRMFKQKQKIRIKNMVNMHICNYYSLNNSLPGKKTKQKIAYNINYVLVANNIYLKETDLKLLISSRIASFKSKIEQGKIPVCPVYKKGDIYTLPESNNKLLM